MSIKPAFTYFRATLFVLLMVNMPQNELKAQIKISDLVEIKHASSAELVGYGLVVGLDRTGDRSLSRRGATFTVQSIANMLNNFGVTVDVDKLRTRNVAAVMVTAKIGPYNGIGSEIDVAVSSMGDASSLQGGVLLQTPLIHPGTDRVYAMAQGALIQGGINAEANGARVAQNQSLTATIPGGASVTYNNVFTPSQDEPLTLILRKPSYMNAQRMAESINQNFEEELAQVNNAGEVQVRWPESFRDLAGMNLFTSLVLDLEIDVDVPARVVINERTGTIVAGGDVVIGEVLISHGAVQIQTQTTPFVSQPAPFSNGQTVQGDIVETGFTEESAQNIVLENDTRVTELAVSLSNLGFSPRDIISIFQAIDRAGALKGKLIIM